MISSERLALLSSSQRRFLCVALDIPQRSSDAAILARTAQLQLADDIAVMAMIDTARVAHQRRADQIDTRYLQADTTNLPTLNNLLLEFTSDELTRLAYKLRFARTYASRLYIAQRIEELAHRHRLTLQHLRIILARKRRLPRPLDDDPQSVELIPGLLDSKS